MQIFIKSGDGVQKPYIIEPTATVKDLKDEAKELFGQTIDRLTFNGKCLSDEAKTLEE